MHNYVGSFLILCLIHPVTICAMELVPVQSKGRTQQNNEEREGKSALRGYLASAKLSVRDLFETATEKKARVSREIFRPMILSEKQHDGSVADPLPLDMLRIVLAYLGNEWMMQKKFCARGTAGQRAMRTFDVGFGGSVNQLVATDDGGLIVQMERSRYTNLAFFDAEQTMVGHMQLENFNRGYSLCLLSPEMVLIGNQSARKVVDIYGNCRFVLADENPEDGDSLFLKLDCGMVAQGNWYGTIKLWQFPVDEKQHTREQKPIRTLQQEGAIQALCSLSSNRLAVGTTAGTITVWDIKSGITVGTMAHQKSVTALAMLGAHQLVVGGDGSISIFDLATYSCLKKYEHKPLLRPEFELPILRLITDSEYIISHHPGGRAKIWHSDTGECGMFMPLLAMAQLSDGRIAGADFDGNIRIWKRIFDARTVDCLLKFQV